MNDLFFKVERKGIFSTFQDSGFFNLQHLGISTGGVMDRNLFKISIQIRSILLVIHYYARLEFYNSQ